MTNEPLMETFKKIQDHIAIMEEVFEFETPEDGVRFLANCYSAQVKLAEITSKLAITMMESDRIGVESNEL